MRREDTTLDKDILHWIPTGRRKPGKAIWKYGVLGNMRKMDLTDEIGWIVNYGKENNVYRLSVDT